MNVGHKNYQMFLKKFSSSSSCDSESEEKTSKAGVDDADELSAT